MGISLEDLLKRFWDFKTEFIDYFLNCSSASKEKKEEVEQAVINLINIVSDEKPEEPNHGTLGGIVESKNDTEIEGLSLIVSILQGEDAETQDRMVSYLKDRYC